MEEFRGFFSAVPDPRALNARHELSEVLFIALAAVLCGAESCADMALFGQAKEGALRQVLRLAHGVPSHDTFSRVFRLLDPKAFETVFRRFTLALGRHLGGVVAIDGKAVRGAYARGKRTAPLHLVNVWAVDARLALAQYTAPGRNEVAGALRALRLLSLKDCIVTADALHCRRDIAAAILAQDGHYALALKDNQPTLIAAAQRLLARRAGGDRATQRPSLAHDRRESRRAFVVADPSLASTLGFPGLAAVARIDTRRQPTGKPAETITRYFLLSTPLSAERLLRVVRDHWSIENQLHWVLDVVLNEDAARNRAGHGPENIAIIRKLALNALRSHPAKNSIRGKIKRAGWEDAFLFSIFAHMR